MKNATALPIVTRVVREVVKRDRPVITEAGQSQFPFVLILRALRR